MEDWVFWIIAAVILAVGEIATMSFYLGPFAVGAALAAVVAALTTSVVLPWVVFIIAGIAVLGIVRPIARSHMRQPPQIRTGTAALVGKRAMVTSRIENALDQGAVRIDGDIWTARAYDDDEVIEPGTRVEVIEIRGATAYVSK
jgi:membrane protein implicated in regulation of membrane protease activity